MRVLLFLNELSCSSPQPRERVDQAMRQFVNVLRSIAAQRGDTSLVTGVKLLELELAPGYYLAEWRGRNVDMWRRIRALQNRAPFKSVLPPGVAEEVDYLIEGKPAKALGAAHLLDGMLVSLPVDPAWRESWVAATRQAMAETPDGETVLLDEAVDVRHAATTDHVDLHREWIGHTGLPGLKQGTEIWDARADLYPHLLFLPRTQAHFSELKHHWVVPAAHELRRINDAIGDWDPKKTAAPMWRSDVSPESSSRKHLCEFEDFDGFVRLFELHGRFAPGYGRVYFRLVPEQRRATVAHVGDHL